MYLLWLALGTFKLISMLGYVNNWNLVLGHPLLKAESETVYSIGWIRWPEEA